MGDTKSSTANGRPTGKGVECPQLGNSGSINLKFLGKLKICDSLYILLRCKFKKIDKNSLFK